MTRFCVPHRVVPLHREAPLCSQIRSYWTLVVTLRAGDLLERALPLVVLTDRTIRATTVALVLVASKIVLETSSFPSP